MAQIDTLTLEVNADISKASQKLDSLGDNLAKIAENMGNVSKSYKTLAKELSKINVPTKNLNNLTKVSTALNSLNTIKSANIETVATNLRSLMDSIKGISISKDATSRIKQVATIGDSLAKLNQVRPANLEKTATNLNSLQGAMSNVSMQSVEKIERLAEAFGKLSSATSSIKGFGEAKKIARTVQETSPTNSTTTTTSGGSEIMQVGNEAQKTSNLLSTLATIASKVKPVLLALKIGLGVIGKAFKAVIKPITNFVKALARIAFYRFIRSIIKNITQGIQQGVQNLALYSKAMEELDAHSANNVMSRYASSFMYFKNAIATALMPLLRGLVPIIETVINRFVDLINVIAQVGSAFFGGTFTKAKYVWIDYADSLDKASGSAKKLHHQLAGFDELNNLTAPSGGSGGANVPDASQMFEESKIDGKIQTFVNKIKDFFEKVQTLTKPYTDRLKKMWDNVAKKVLPDLKKIYDNLKKIWDELLAPIIEEFIKGWLEGFFGTEIENLPDAIDKVSEKIKDWTDKLVDLKDKLPTEKIKDFANKVGFVTGKISAMVSPINLLLLVLDPWKSASAELGKIHGDKLAPAVEKTIWKLITLKEKLKNAYDATLNLQNPTSWLSEKLATLALKAITVYTQFQTVIDKVKNLQTHFDVLKNWFTVFNPFKSVQERADALHTALENIKAGLEFIKKITEIVITISLKVTGQDAVKNALEQLGDTGKKIANEIDNKIKGDEGNQKDKGGQEKAQVDNKSKNPQRPTSPSSGNAPSGYADITSYINDQKKKANGGFVSRGDLFIANEKMPEFIGSIGGNTAVANNDQITEAIAQATYNAMSKALAENGGSVNIVVEGDGDKMFKVFQKKQTEYNRRTGFAY